MLDRLFALETFGIRLGLDHIERLCAALGHPERQFTTVHVAGTNGKGSVTAMVHAALVEAGLAAARYTSPHLVSLHERFVIGRAPVDTPALEAAATLVLDTIDQLKATGDLPASPTFFEATTAIAFELFRRAGVQVAVIEVGLGGRFDATNVLTPAVAAITSIGLDHQQYLGNSVEAIAREKAGIIKAARPVVLGAMPAAAEAVIRGIAAERRAPIVGAADHASVHADVVDGRARVRIETPDDCYGPLPLGLRGAHQVGNALVAVRVLEQLRRCGVAVPAEAIAGGLSGVEWPARLELLHVTAADGGRRRVLVDAAHNADGARALAEYLARWHPERPALLIGVMRDKDIDAILTALLPVTSTVVATEAPTPRALPAADLAARVAAADRARRVLVEPDAAAAAALAMAAAPSVCVAGSIFLAGALRDHLK